MRNYRLVSDNEMETTARGIEVLKTPQLNKGVAFNLEERDALHLHGLLPPAVLSIDEQARRAYQQYSNQPNDLFKNVYLTALHARNEGLFYRLLTEHIHEMLSIVYTPTVGRAIQQYSELYRRPLGVYLSIDNPDDIPKAFENFGASADEIDLIVATDGERILGLGDWGVGGIDIAIGKLAVYTAAAGIHPSRVIPVVLDVGTNQESLLNDPFYIGNRHSRVTGKRYDAFIDAYVTTASKMFPKALLHWEDFAERTARPILERYRDKICTFNDDIQGTGVISLAAVISGAIASGVPLDEHRIVIFGSGSAGIGVANQIRDKFIDIGLSEEEANRRFWCVDRDGLLVDNMDNLQDFQKPYARPRDEVKKWTHNKHDGTISFKEVVSKVHPTILIGTSTVAGVFTKEIVEEMAEHAERPIILPLSNPTSSSEAKPSDLISWTDGKALVATGSPFDPVTYKNETYVIGQANNAFVFPGIGLGTVVSRAKRVTDGMLIAAAEAVAKMVDTSEPGHSLLPQVEKLRAVSATVAVTVVKAAIQDGVAEVEPDDIIQSVQDAMWTPDYYTVKPVKSFEK